MLEIFQFCFQFCKIKGNENISFTDHESWIRLRDCSKLPINPKNDNNVIVCRPDVIVTFFWRSRVSLIKFSYWSKFHVNIITGSGVITIFVYKGLTRNPEIGNTLVWVLPNIWRLGRVRDTIFGTNALMKSYWLLQNARVTAFTVFQLLRENQQGVKLPPPRLGLRIKDLLNFDQFVEIHLKMTLFFKMQVTHKLLHMDKNCRTWKKCEKSSKSNTCHFKISKSGNSCIQNIVSIYFQMIKIYHEWCSFILSQH